MPRMFIMSGVRSRSGMNIVVGVNYRGVVLRAHRGVSPRVQVVSCVSFPLRRRLSDAMIHRRVIVPADARVTGV